jgi:hypothetical protein
MITFKELKKKGRKSSFCSLSIEDSGNMDLTGYRAVDVLYRRNICMESEADTAHNSADTIPFQPIEGLFLKLQVLRH